MTTADLKQTDFIKAWAIFWIASTISGSIIGFIGGAMLGLILSALGASIPTVKVLCGGLGFLLSIPISYICFQFSIRKFLLPKLSTPQTQDLPEQLAA